VIAWARAQASEDGGDPDRIVLAGRSFGARLATLAGFTVAHASAVVAVE
jgi:acetyl esterase/lipase